MQPSTDRYASHLPVLRRLLGIHKPERVLEYGAGLHSTPLFAAYPTVEKVVSVEPDPEWRQIVALEVADPRLTLRPDANVMPSAFDFVFIDCGMCIADRVPVIRAVLASKHPLVVIHDAEVPAYADAIEELATMFKIHPTAPDTAVIAASDV